MLSTRKRVDFYVSHGIVLGEKGIMPRPILLEKQKNKT